MSTVGWKETALGDVIDVRHGYAFKGEFFSSEPGPIVVTPGNFREEGGFKPKEPEKYYSGPIPDGFVLSSGDLVVAMTEQKRGLLGSAARIPANGVYLHNQRLGLVVANAPGRTHSRFLYYLFNSFGVRAQIQATANGAKVRHTSPSRIRDVRIQLPALPVQLKIAAVLAAYDELIENNLRRISILEEMGQSVYREWFVHYRFPGFEDAEFIGSGTRQAPEGWEKANLFDIADVGFGYAFGSSQFTTDPVGEKVVRIRDIPKNDSRTYTTEAAEERYRVRNGDILIGMDGDFHMCVWSGNGALLNQRVARLRPIGDIPVWILFHSVAGPIKHFEATITGTTVAHLGKRHLQTIEILIPPARVLDQAREVLDPMLALLLNLHQQNKTLRSTRDVLLPKLVSGEIDVSDLDIDTDWLVA